MGLGCRGVRDRESSGVESYWSHSSSWNQRFERTRMRDDAVKLEDVDLGETAASSSNATGKAANRKLNATAVDEIPFLNSQGHEIRLLHDEIEGMSKPTMIWSRMCRTSENAADPIEVEDLKRQVAELREKERVLEVEKKIDKKDLEKAHEEIEGLKNGELRKRVMVLEMEL